MSVVSQGIGDQGAITDFSSYFQAINCANLPFGPKFSVSQLGGRKQSHRSANPALHFDLRTRPGEANIRSIAVTLPPAYSIDQRHLGNLCSEKELVSTKCAGRTAIGKARTDTPLLDQPLAGPAFAVSGAGGLPRLAFVLDGQVGLVPRAESLGVRGGLKTTVPVVPDAPIGHFALDIFGGRHGYLQNTRDVCARPPAIKIEYKAHSGRTFVRTVKVRTPCTRSKGKHSRR
jgi:hypothetical protein